MNFRFAKISEAGNFRENNQDRIFANTNKFNNFLGLVCDGIGGHPDGDLAAQITVDALSESFNSLDFSNFSVKQIGKWFKDTIQLSIERMKRAVQLGKSDLMGTTLTGILVNQDAIVVVNVGDSRVYEINFDGLNLMTIDQNVKNTKDINIKKQIEKLMNKQLAKSNDDTVNDNFRKRLEGILVSAIGPSSNTIIDVNDFEIQDINFFIASDGLYNFVSTNNIIDSFKDDNLEYSLNKLVQIATNNHSTDNMSGILVEVHHG